MGKKGGGSEEGRKGQRGGTKSVVYPIYPVTLDGVSLQGGL